MIEHDNLIINHLPDIHELFKIYDLRLFEGILSDNVMLKWSNRMKSCAGVCKIDVTQIHISLSRPILQYRCIKDIIDILLHEMIHAYLFIKNGFRNRRSHDSTFIQLMRSINAKEGANITIFHSYSNEVSYLKKFKWQCSGPCRNIPPYYGWIEKSVNKPPGPLDPWWYSHQKSCGGSFVPIKIKIARPSDEIVDLTSL